MKEHAQFIFTCLIFSLGFAALNAQNLMDFFT